MQGRRTPRESALIPPAGPWWLAALGYAAVTVLFVTPLFDANIFCPAQQALTVLHTRRASELRAAVAAAGGSPDVELLG